MLRIEVMVVNPSSNYHFWCLWQEKKNGVFVRYFLNNLRLKKIFFCKKLNRKFWRIQFTQFSIKLHFSPSNINIEWFQLSYDLSIVSISLSWVPKTLFPLNSRTIWAKMPLLLASFYFYQSVPGGNNFGTFSLLTVKPWVEIFKFRKIFCWKLKSLCCQMRLLWHQILKIS